MQNTNGYGLQMVFPQLVPLPPPPSAFTTVGMTRVLINSTTAPRTSSTRFTVVFSLWQESNRDIFMAAGVFHNMLVIARVCSEFVTK